MFIVFFLIITSFFFTDASALELRNNKNNNNSNQKNGIIFAADDDQNNYNNNNTQNENDKLLREFVSKLVLKVQKIDSIEFFHEEFKLTIEGVECTAFSVDAVKSKEYFNAFDDDSDDDDDDDERKRDSLMKIEIENARARCTGVWDVSNKILSNSAKGSIEMSIVGAALNVSDIKFLSSSSSAYSDSNSSTSGDIKYKLPKSIEYQFCSMEIASVDNLKFSSASDDDDDHDDGNSEEILKLLNKASTEIAKALKILFEREACSELKKLSESQKALDFFSAVDEYVLKEFLFIKDVSDNDDDDKGNNNNDTTTNTDNTTTTTTTQPKNDFFDWNDSTLIRVLNFISSKYIGTSGPRSLNEFVKWFTNNTGILTVPQERLIDSESHESIFVFEKKYDVVNDSANKLFKSISFAIEAVEILGLDTADILYGPVAGGHALTEKLSNDNNNNDNKYNSSVQQPPVADSSSLLGFSVGWNKTEVRVRGLLKIIPWNETQSPSWIEDLMLNLEINSMEIDLDIALEVSEKKWEMLTQEQFKNMACLFGVVRKFDVEQLRWDGTIAKLTIDNSDFEEEGDKEYNNNNNLEADLQSAVSNLSELITSTYKETVTAIVSNEFKEVFQPIINALISIKFGEISNEVCPKQNVKSLEIAKVANTFASLFFLTLAIACIILAILVRFVIPASYIRSLNRRAEKKIRAREMHDPFDGDGDNNCDDLLIDETDDDEDDDEEEDDKNAESLEDDENNNDDDVERNQTPTMITKKKTTPKKKKHRRGGSAILATLLGADSDSYSDDDYHVNIDDDYFEEDEDNNTNEGEQQQQQQQRGSLAETSAKLKQKRTETTNDQKKKKKREYARRFPETAWMASGKNKSSNYKKLFSDSLSKSMKPNSRWCLRLMFMANIFLFLSANTDSGASVSLFATLTTPVVDSQSTTIEKMSATSTATLDVLLQQMTNNSAPVSSETTASNTNNEEQEQKFIVVQASREDLFNFSLVGTVRDMWHAKVYVIAILIVLFSGVWPYLKIFGMFFLWEISGKIVKSSTRGKFLKIVDRLGKWSLFDSFVMTMFMVAFRFHLHTVEDVNKNQNDGPLSFGDLDVVVQPKRSFYVFLSATILSLVLGHAALSMHRKSISSKTEVDDKATPLWRRDEKNPERLLRTKSAFAQAVAVFVLLVCSCSFLAIGVCTSAIQFDFLGIAGYALGSEEKTRSFSLVKLAQALPHASDIPGNAVTNKDHFFSMAFIGPRFIQVTFWIFAVIAPLMQMVILCLLWVWPLTPRTQRRYQTLAEICSAWSSLDVVLFAVVAAMLQIKRFANFVVGGGCLSFNTALAAISNRDTLNVDDECFDLDTAFEPGCWLLIASALMSNFVGIWVTKRCDMSVANNELRLRSSLLRGLREESYHSDLDDDDDDDDGDDLDDILEE
jgi:hypothetical protein